MRKFAPVAITIAGVLTLIVIWAPWLTRTEAEERAAAALESAQEGVVDGCGFNCAGCGVVESRRTLLGYEVTLEYGCGVMPADAPEYHERAVVRVTAWGTVRGVPGR